jgi:arylsulfatase A-like enzyme
MRDYFACVDAVDESIGHLLKYLDDEGIADNTIVIYASDQGFYLGEHGWFDKRFMYNESFKTPLLVRWNGRVKPGTVNDDIVSLLDLPETFLDIAGIAIPEDMQGRSFVPLLEGNTPADWRKSFYYHYYEYPSVHMVKKHEGVYDGRFKLIHFYDDIDHWELIDLQTDPLELKNVFAETQYAEEVKRLKGELERLKTELNVPPVVVNTQSYLFDEEKAKTRPNLQPLFEQVRKDVEKRERVIERSRAK